MMNLLLSVINNVGIITLPNGSRLYTTRRETALLLAFKDYEVGTPLSREHLMEEIYKERSIRFGLRNIDRIVSRISQKISIHGNLRIIKSAHNMGYFLIIGLDIK